MPGAAVGVSKNRIMRPGSGQRVPKLRKEKPMQVMMATHLGFVNVLVYECICDLVSVRYRSSEKKNVSKDADTNLYMVAC